MPQKKPWLSEILDVLLKLGGKAYLKEIYREIANRKRMDLTSPSWRNTIRRTIFSHSSDTKYFHTIGSKDAQDIFYAPKGMGAGFWAIRETYLEELGFDHTENQRYWIEKVLVKGHPEKENGEYAFGHVLRSAQKDKGGKDIYHYMRDIQPGDIILHFTDNSAFTAISQAKSSYEEFSGLPGTDMATTPAYIVRLHNFRRLEPPLTRETIFTSPFREQLTTLLNLGVKNLFFTVRAEVASD